MTENSRVLQEATAQDYVNFYEALSPGNLSDLEKTMSEDVHFIDPFNDIKGREHVLAILKKMFEDVDNPKFIILDVAWSERSCYLRWQFSCFFPILGDWVFNGMTELRFNAEGKICAHYDYWDSGLHFYAKLPVIGWFVRLIRRKASLKPASR